MKKSIFEQKFSQMNLFIISLAPIVVIAFYIYFRDKYEKEPLGMLLLSLFAGGIITIPIVLIEMSFEKLNPFTDQIFSATYNAFIVAGLTEEMFKWIAIVLLIWKNKNFNERFDGIVYAVFVSLGFAMVENILYVFSNGFNTGLIRAFTAVPFHASCGIFMGFYFGIAKFDSSRKGYYLFLALFLPIIFHGIYDFFLMTKHQLYLLLWIPFYIFFILKAFRKLKKLSKLSVINTEIIDI